MVAAGATFVLLLLAIAAKADPGPKMVKCQDRNFPDCFHVKLFCPEDCLRTCMVDCATCQPVCSFSPPSEPIESPPTSPPPPPTTQTPPTPLPPVATPPTAQTPPPSPKAKRSRCKSRHFPHCYRMEFTCPSACPDSCEVDCVTCRPVCNCNQPGAVCQDPRFVGGDGLAFYFHGKKDRDFCLVSDTNLHINGHFIGRRDPNMRRDFTWVQSLGILFGRHRLFIGARKTAAWNNAIDRLTLAFDGEPVSLPDGGEGAQWVSTSSSPRASITRFHDTNAVEIEVHGSFRIRAKVVPITHEDSEIHKYGITEEDCFAHLDLGFKFYTLSGNVSGVLGQTYASNYVSKVKMGVAMPVLGGEREFASSGLFTADCAVAQFSGSEMEEISSSMNLEYANLKRDGGIGGHGVVCKR